MSSAGNHTEYYHAFARAFDRTIKEVGLEAFKTTSLFSARGVHKK